MSSTPRLTDEQLRALVRDAVARHLGQAAPASSTPAADAGTPAVTINVFAHPSHSRYQLSSGSPDELRDGPCLIEPAVKCNHCGYCQSHGH